MLRRRLSEAAVSLCPKDCEIPEEEHVCAGLGLAGHRCSGALSHQHRPKKGMGGRGHKTYGEPSVIVGLLCWSLHSQLDNNAGRPYRDEVIEEDGVRYYRIWAEVRREI